MEVSGKKNKNVLCQPCEGEDRLTHAEGYCQECGEYMCKSCFNNHRKWNVCKNHVLLGMNEEQLASGSDQDDEKLEKCQQHFDGHIKFYCPVHDTVGCGDCMVLGHKTCTVEYIRDKSRTFKDSQEFKDMMKVEDDCIKEANQLASLVSNNKIQVMDINAQFISDVHRFRDELIAHVNTLANEMIMDADKVKLKDSKDIEALEKETEELKQEISQLQQRTQSQIDEPIKLFTGFILDKPAIRRIREQLTTMEMRNSVEVYSFQRDAMLEHSVNECGALGKISKRTVDQENKPEPTLVVKQMQVVKEIVQLVSNIIQQPKPQTLIDRQLRCDNIAVNENYLSYIDNGHRDVGLYIDKNEAKFESYFEVEIINMGQRGTIAIGIVPGDYPMNTQPGWLANSIGYHADDGGIFYENGHATTYGAACSVGDRLSCAATYLFPYSISVTLAKNEKKIGGIKMPLRKSKLYFAVGMHSSGEQVKVIRNQKSTLE